MKRIALFLCFFVCALEVFAQFVRNTDQNQISVNLPYEKTINESKKLIIKENGMIEFGNNVFIYNKDGLQYHDIKVLITFSGKDNLFGVNILETVSDGAVIDYTLIFNIETQEEIQIPLYEKGRYFGLWGFFDIGNCFILTSGKKAYGYNSITGELLWIQEYRLKNGSSIVNNKEYLLIDDIDGNKYKIYGDGRKIKI